jgi:hypothetical protein
MQLTRPGKLSRRRLEILHCDPPRKTKPQEVGNFALRGSVGAGFTGMFVINVTQVTVSSNWFEGLSLFWSMTVAVVRW